jgi:predicted nucleic acid-binding protein
MICVDASVAAKWILEEEDWAQQAEALLGATLRAGEPIVAPPLLPYEITNILRQRQRTAASVSLDRVVFMLEEFSRLPIELHYPPGLHRHALILADTFGLPAAYDAHYLVLAEQFACTLWTDDRRLLRALDGRLPFVRPIGDYEPSAGADLA